MLKNLKNKKKKRGFTLIELIIVIAIIAILAVIAIPKFGEVRKNANISADKANAKQLQNSVTMVISDGSVSLPSSNAEILFDGKSDANDKNDTTGIENAVKDQLQNAIPKIKLKGSATYFTIEVTDKGVTTIKAGDTEVYPNGKGDYEE